MFLVSPVGRGVPMGRWIAGSRHHVALGLGIAIGIRDLRLFGEGNNKSETEVWVSCSVITPDRVARELSNIHKHLQGHTFEGWWWLLKHISNFLIEILRIRS